jgi:short-subunit dehydrogenase
MGHIVDETTRSMVRHVLITGGSSGIGYALSLKFAEKGYGLMWVSNDGQQLEEASLRIKSDFPMLSLHTLCADLTVPNQCDLVFEWAIKLGDVEVLVNCAGFGTFGHLHTINESVEMSMIHLNVLSMYRLTRLFSQVMLRKGHGRIANIASNTVLQPVPHMCTYAATKSFVNHFSLSLHEELRGTGITVTTIIPPATRDTQFQHKAGMDGVKTFRGLLTASADEVASRAYKGIMRGDRMVYGGWKLQFSRPLAAILPHRVIQWLIKKELDRN